MHVVVANLTDRPALFPSMAPDSIHEDAPQRRIQELEAEISALRNSEARYRGIIENMELGILEVDRAERVVRALPRFCEIVGYTEAELLGKKASDVLLDEEAKANMDSETAARNAGSSGLYETPIRTKSGELKWLLISGVPTVSPDGDITGSMGIHYDITERKRDEQRMAQAMEEAQLARKTEREFLARMSHEIRTPMTAILGMTRLLGDTPLTAHQQTLWKAMSEGGQVLQNLLDGVLNLTRLDAGRMEVRNTAVEIATLTTGVVAPFRPVMAEKGVNFDLSLPDAGLQVEMDGTLYTQVLMNLLGNAVKFTDAGVISVKLELAPLEGQDHVKLVVTDSGIGIPEEDRALIFERFKQASNREFRHQGSGLGLSIVGDIVSLMKGRIHVVSDVGQGSRFEARWPVERVQAEPTSGARIPDEDWTLDAAVLVAEDNEINALLLRTILERWGARVQVVENGLLALEAWQGGAFDLICMDVQMPIRDGMWATGRIREEEEGRIPILGLSAFAMEADKQAALDAGMDGYVTKPFAPEALRRTVQRLLP